jgi:hypothetical protein
MGIFLPIIFSATIDALGTKPFVPGQYDAIIAIPLLGYVLGVAGLVLVIRSAIRRKEGE